MSNDQVLILLILCALLVCFMWGKWRYDVVAMLALLASIVLGVVPSTEAFTGFGHPATITVAIVLVLSHALTKSGAIEGITRAVAPSTKYTFSHIAALTILAACLSMFMNNVGALALLMPIAIQSAIKSGRSPALLLMPLSFGSILGGLVTLIGTPPNIIIATYREQATGESFRMFDFAPVGGAIALAGVAFIALLGWRLLPKHAQKDANAQDLFEIESYISEVRIPEESSLVGMTIDEEEKATQELNVIVVSMMRGKQNFSTVRKNQPFAAGDILLLEGSHEDIDKFVTKFSLEIGGTKAADMLREKGTELIEVVVGPASRIEGRTASQVRFRSYYGVNLLAASRQGKPYRGRINSFKFRTGDVLLLHGEKDALPDVVARLGCLPLAERGIDFGRRRHADSSLVLFIAAIVAASLGWLPIQVSLGLAAVGMVLFRILPAKEIYDGIDWPVIVLLGAMIPIGSALETTGTTDLIVTGLLNMAEGIPIVVILGLVLVVTMTLSDILNNAATAILMAPIGVTIASQTGTNPDTFLMAVAVGASCAFLTPIGHQNNALVMGPGGYRFGDYWRMGLPLEILIVAVAIPMILIIWPL